MKKYSVIVLDLGNVLLPFDYSQMVKHFSNLKPGMGSKFIKLYQDNYEIHRKYERGDISTEQFLNIMINWLDYSVTEEEFCKMFSGIFTHNQNVIDLLPKLKRNYTLCLLSNTNEIHQKYGYNNEEFLSNFDKLFLSHEIGALKPEEKIYRAVEAYTHKPSNEHLFIDDIGEYCRGAVNCGWDAIQFTGYDNLILEFEKRGVLL
jgi:HAD superfamily hydrolase (TIGR01509 family)